MHWRTYGLTLDQLTVCHMCGAKPLSEPMNAYNIGIDINIDVIVVSLTTWEAHHSPRAKPEGCGELPRSFMRQQWPKLMYKFLFYHYETKLMMNKPIL